MRVKLWIGLILFLLAPSPGHATDPDEGPRDGDTGVSLIEPRVIGPLAARVRWNLRTGYRRAAEDVHSESCRALFTELGAEPSQVLSYAMYSAPVSSSEGKICTRRRAVAFTVVGRGRTVLCPAFGQLNPDGAAAVIIHEALHNAGQPEWPRDPEAPTSAQINRLVLARCGK